MTDSRAEQLAADYFQHPLAYYARMRAEGPVTPVILPYSNGSLIHGLECLPVRLA